MNNGELLKPKMFDMGVFMAEKGGGIHVDK